MDIDDALAWNSAQGNSVWLGLNAVEQKQMLARASNYMALKYRLRAPANDAETQLIASARYSIALDLATNSSLPGRYTGQVTRTVMELEGLKKQTDYAPIVGQVDPYPDITAVLYPLIIRNSTANYAIGVQQHSASGPVCGQGYNGGDGWL